MSKRDYVGIEALRVHSGKGEGSFHSRCEVEVCFAAAPDCRSSDSNYLDQALHETMHVGKVQTSDCTFGTNRR